jgi:hypothetical protein
MAHELDREHTGADRLPARPAVDTRVDVIAHKLPPPGVEVTKGLLLTFEPKRDRDEEMRRFLIDAESLAEDERGTTAWFAIRLESGEYGIFDVFPDNGARRRHLRGHVPRQLAKEAFSLLGGLPELHLLDVVSTTIPRRPRSSPAGASAGDRHASHDAAMGYQSRAWINVEASSASSPGHRQGRAASSTRPWSTGTASPCSPMPSSSCPSWSPT